MQKPSGIIEQLDQARYSADRKKLLEQEMNPYLRMLKEHGHPVAELAFNV